MKNVWFAYAAISFVLCALWALCIFTADNANSQGLMIVGGAIFVVPIEIILLVIVLIIRWIAKGRS